MSKVDKPWETLAYAFVVDFDAPNFVTSGTKIFNLEEQDVDQLTENESKSTIETIKSEAGASDQFGLSVGLAASFGCFSCSASLGIDKASTTTTRTMRTNSYIRAKLNKLSAGAHVLAAPQKYLDADVHAVIEAGELSMPGLEALVGHFSCYHCDLGGVFQKSYIVEVTEKDTTESVETSLEASYGPGLASGAANASVGVHKSTVNKDAEMRIEQSCLGGNSALWLGATDTNQIEIQQQWAATVSADNSFPVDVELKFIWDIVIAINPAYGKKYKKYLTAKWDKSEVDYENLVYIDEGLPTPIAYGDQLNVINQYNAANGYLDTAGGKNADGDGVLDGFGVRTSNTPNRDHGSGTWEIVKWYKDAVFKQPPKTSVQHGDLIMLINQYERGALGYLVAYGATSDITGGYQVRTVPSFVPFKKEDPDTVKTLDLTAEAYSWQILKVSSGDAVIRKGDRVHLVCQLDARKGHLDTYGGNTNDNGEIDGYGVETSPNANRDQGSGTWEIQINASVW